jgi:cytochrome c-type biogenesis protein CcmF
VSAVGLGLLLVTVFFANPFVVLDLPAVDGSGLLAILQHPAMIYHPPILYTGLVVLVVPFALTMGMAMGEGDRTTWMALVRRWLYLSWVLLTVGMAAGANWAYAELGWGGYWAWDPVENTALMPWIATTAFLHTGRIEESSGRLRRWNVSFASLPFALSVVGVYLTRSGSTGSIHSFAEDPVVGRVLIGGAVLVLVAIVVVALRSERGEPWETFRLDRNGWLGLNAIILTVALVFVAAGSIYPAFVSVFLGQDTTVDVGFFVVTMLPIAVMVATSQTLALRRDWRLFLVGSLVAGAVCALIVEFRAGVPLMAVALTAVGLIGAGLLTDRPRRRLLVAYLAHLGVAVFLVGVAGSSFGGEFQGAMVPGDAIEVSGHELTLEQVETGEGDRFVFVRAAFDVDGSTLSPEIRAYENQAVPVAEPVVRRGPLEDVILAISLLFPDGETVEVSVFVKPLVSLVWLGVALMALAGLVALFGRVEAVATPRRWATEVQPVEETTSGTSSQ